MYQIGAAGVTQNSNTVVVTATPPASPAAVRFFQYAPNAPDASALAFDGGGYGGVLNDASGASFTPLPVPQTIYGNPIDLSSPVGVRETTAYHAGETVFAVLSDPSRNTDPGAREFINLTLSDPVTGDVEVLRLQETGPDSGVFAAAIQSRGSGQPASAGDGVIAVDVDTRLQVDYQDPADAADVVVESVLVDPYGIVFDSLSGAPVPGATVTLINADTGQPATVYCDDGISLCPATLITPAAPTPVAGVGTLPPGGYRFPFVQPGHYRIAVTPPASYAVPSTVCTIGNCPVPQPPGPYAVVQGSFGERFVVVPGPTLNIDVPADPLATVLLLQKAASRPEISAGDFLQYRLNLRNRDTTDATGVVVTDTLPPGFRYESGSLRVAGVAAADPAIGADGRTLSIAAGTVAAGSGVEIRYVVQSASGQPAREAVNLAQAAAAGGALSNVARAAVRVRRPFFSAGFTLIGRVEEACDDDGTRRGVPNVRIVLDDGTYVGTDRDGLYHFEGLRPGTHVVQLDTDSLAPGLRVVPAIRNSRFAGQAHSQFVDVRGGGLWRADFHVCRDSAPVGLKLSSRTERSSPRSTGPLLRYTLYPPFPPGHERLGPRSEGDLRGLMAALEGVNVERIEVIGHTDDLAPWPSTGFKDNDELSLARAVFVGAHLQKELGLDPSRVAVSGRGATAPLVPNDSDENRRRNRRTEVHVYDRGVSVAAPMSRHRVVVDGAAVAVSNLRVSVLLPDGAGYVAGSARVDGGPSADPEVVEGAVTFRLGDAGADWERVIEFDSKPAPDRACAAGVSVVALATFDTAGGKGLRTPRVEIAPACASSVESERATVQVRGPEQAVAAEPAAATRPRSAIATDIEAAGGDTDWLEGASAGIAWRFPSPEHSPRAPATRVVIQHARGQTVELSANGEAVSALNFDGVQTRADGAVAVSIWRGVPLRDGPNRLEARVLAADGSVVETLQQTVHYSNAVARAELVPEQSVLVADGLNPPVVAVRMLDRDGRPVRAGVGGGYRLNPPFLPRQTLEQMQQRQLAGLDRFEPTWRVEGDDGVAYIELQPTTESGEAVLNFEFQSEATQQTVRRQELRAWIAAAPREWLLVGFAEGTVGYNTLKDNLAAVPAGVEDEVYTDGQASFYAKGRVKGEWLATLAYDSGKSGDRGSLLSTIDPNEYYTLYGDGTEQRYDAPSQAKLYLKLERRQFFALFGDFTTGLTVTQLSRYSRTLNGVNVGLGGGPVVVSAFAADTAQNFVRDEIRGEGTSGLYRLSRRPLVLNSEKIRIETRDRHRSEQVRDTRALVRHLDYDVDYANGTLFFREPIPSRDADFNPVYIVAEYETFGGGDKDLAAGGRVGVNLAGGAVSAGVSGIREESFAGDGDLAGVDLKWRVREGTELRLEGAHSEGQLGPDPRDGDGWLAEVEHHDGRFDGLLYSRRLDAGFGLGQQSAAQTGTDRIGADLAVRLTPELSVLGQAYRQENLVSDATRNVGGARLQYRTDSGAVSAGYQLAEDEAGTGEQFRSQQATVAASRWLWDRRLELSASGDFALNDEKSNLDFPARYQLGAAWALTQDVRLLLAQELTDGDAFDTTTTRVGLQAVPWQGARLSTTLNQTTVSENGPRTYAQMGLGQTWLIGERWGVDVGVDSSRTLKESGQPAFVFNPDQASAVTGGNLTEDFVAVTSGLTYRSELWSWNGRAEARNASTADRYGLTTGFLRQAQAGVAFAASAQMFQAELDGGAEGRYGNLNLSWAWRPLESRWSLLDRLEFKYDEISGVGAAGGAPLALGSTLDPAADARARRVVNNLSVNRVSREWSTADREGNLFRLEQRNQWSLYYGSKYSFDQYDGVAYRGYTDLVGAEWRYDLTPRWDLGVQASSLNAWTQRTHEYSFGPQAGFTPFTNGWLTLGYNLRGFQDRDFEAARYTAEGPYLKIRIKFDQNTLRRGADRAATPDEEPQP